MLTSGKSDHMWEAMWVAVGTAIGSFVSTVRHVSSAFLVEDKTPLSVTGLAECMLFGASALVATALFSFANSKRKTPDDLASKIRSRTKSKP